MMDRSEHVTWMERALALAAKGEGLTRPNPPVGGILLSRKGDCVAEAWHKRAGGPHAEALLLRKAGDAARGGTLYVTLEPCSTHGRTPPCTEAILASGIKRVVVGCQDPNPRHAGKGLRHLIRNGVDVTTGVCKPEAEALIEPFACWVQRGTPFVTLKLATSLDGRIADAKRRSQWITGKVARTNVHTLRRRVDAVLVGAGTVREDNPSLLPRPLRGRKTYRIVVTSTCRLDPSAKIFTDGEQERTIVLTTKRASATKKAALAATGAEVLMVTERKGRPSLKAGLRLLGQRGLLHVLCEGGGELAGSLIVQELVDDVQLFVAPIWLGDQGSLASLQGVGWPLSQAPSLKVKDTHQVGDDLFIHARPL